MGGGNFRVEEYKKPEFEVTVDAPKEPIKLGEKITATIKAKYYFGTPVVNAKVHYKVTAQSARSRRWFPVAPWDWFYEPGYWWFASDYNWYPGFGEWGMRAPMPHLVGRPSSTPEIVAENEVPVGADGTVKVEIDTALAKAVHGDEDHKYTITAEVTDQSRRTIVGSGERARGAQAIQGLCVGQSRLLPDRRRDRSLLLRADAGQQADRQAPKAS